MSREDGSIPTVGDTASSAGERRRRPGGRSARVRAAVLEATLDQLAESGYDGLSFEAVAVRAGVHKTTLYRRWSDRTALVLDAMLELSSQTVPVPDLGSVRADLMAIGRGIAGNLSSPRVLGVSRALLAAGHERALSDAVRGYWEARFGLVGQVLTRATARGELPSRVSPDFLIEMLIGPLYLRALVLDRRLDAAFVESLVDFVLAGARTG